MGALAWLAAAASSLKAAAVPSSPLPLHGGGCKPTPCALARAPEAKPAHPHPCCCALHSVLPLPGGRCQVWDSERVVIIPDHYIFTSDPRANRNVDILREMADKCE